MNSFPYESWDEALAEPGGYYTWADSSSMSWLLALLGIALAVAWLAWMVVHENQHLNAAAGRLNDKWGI